MVETVLHSKREKPVNFCRSLFDLVSIKQSSKEELLNEAKDFDSILIMESDCNQEDESRTKLSLIMTFVIFSFTGNHV